MRRVTTDLAAGLGALALALAGLTAASPSALAATNDQGSPATAQTVTSAPFSVTLDGDDATDPSTGAGNDAVATACNAGHPITAARWWRYAPATTTSVFARAEHATNYFIDRPFEPTPDPNGLAIVSTTGTVLACSSNAAGVVDVGPRSVAAGTSVLVVHFLTACGDDPVFTGCSYASDSTRQFAIRTATSGAAPSGDDWQSATPVTGALPQSRTVDTTFATAQAADPVTDLEACFHVGDPVFDSPVYRGPFRSAWFSYTPTTTGPVTLSVDGKPQLGGTGELIDDPANGPLLRAVRPPSDPTGAYGAPRALIAPLTAAGPDFSALCTASYPPVLRAGTTYAIVVGDADNSPMAGGSRTLTIGPAQPDLVVTGVTATPAHPVAGVPTRFSATVRNAGTAATPAGVITGVRFRVDGHAVTYSDTRTAAIAPGQSVTIAASSTYGGGDGRWVATAGSHTVQAWADDINRITSESVEANNSLTMPLTVTTAGAGSYQESSADLVYAGSWATRALAGDSGGAERTATSGPASVTLTFHGTQVGWTTRKGSSLGRARVYLDGVLLTTYDGYAATPRSRVLGFSRGGLAAGTHTLQIAWTGAKTAAATDDAVVVDSLRVY